MLPYNIEFFNRNLSFAYSFQQSDLTLDEDYLAGTPIQLSAPITDIITVGQFVRIANDKLSYFGVVSEVNKEEFTLQVSVKPFVTAFDEEFLFDSSYQGSDSETGLETVIASYIYEIYVNTTDTSQQLPLIITVDSDITPTTNWSLGIYPDDETTDYCVANLYTDVIAAAMRLYGVVVEVTPNFGARTISLKITKKLTEVKIDANLDGVRVKTLLYNKLQSGINKLVVYNADNYAQSITFYVYQDGSWGLDDENRIIPVNTTVKTASADEEMTFAEAAVDVAYSTLSGIEWDNLIELEVTPDDPLIKPLELKLGQKVSIWYKGGKYTSILTARKIETKGVMLSFGSERIEYSKRLRIERR